MKKIKQTLSILLAAVMVLCLLPVAASAETFTGECGLEGDNLTWTFDEETGVLSIDGTGAMDNYKLYNNVNKTNAPWWDYYSQMTELVIGDGVTSIGEYAFYNCDTLKSFTNPGNIKTIGKYAFYDCKKMVDVDFKDSILSIGEYAFCGCRLQELSIPNSVKVLEKYSFRNCAIQNLKIGDGLTEIGDYVFYGNGSIFSIDWGKNLKRIGKFAFYQDGFKGGSTYVLSNIVIPNGIEYIDSYAFVIGGGDWANYSVSIPLSVKTINQHAFENRVRDVYYEGTIEQWEKISIDTNEGLRNANIHFGHNHEYTSEVTTEPTCTATGVKTYTCSCGESYTRTLSALGHDIVIDSAVPATCTQTGLTQGEHCTRCDYAVAQEETPALGHDEVEIPAVPATCTKTGLTAGIGCSRCDMVFKAQEVIPMAEHTIETVPAVAPTCTEKGRTEGRICTVCGEAFEGGEEIPALGHTPATDPAVPATCTQTGLTEGSHCSVCGEVLAEQEVVPAKGHTEIFTAYVEPTCTETGLSVGKICSECGAVFIPQQIIPAKGHHYTGWIVTSSPTCETNGKKINFCTSCGIYEEEIIPATGHVDADNDGKCDNCSASLRDEPNQGNNSSSALKRFFEKIIEFFKRIFGIK